MDQIHKKLSSAENNRLQLQQLLALRGPEDLKDNILRVLHKLSPFLWEMERGILPPPDKVSVISLPDCETLNYGLTLKALKTSLLVALDQSPSYKMHDFFRLINMCADWWM